MNCLHSLLSSVFSVKQFHSTMCYVNFQEIEKCHNLLINLLVVVAICIKNHNKISREFLLFCGFRAKKNITRKRRKKNIIRLKINKKKIAREDENCFAIAKTTNEREFCSCSDSYQNVASKSSLSYMLKYQFVTDTRPLLFSSSYILTAHRIFFLNCPLVYDKIICWIVLTIKQQPQKQIKHGNWIEFFVVSGLVSKSKGKMA